MGGVGRRPDFTKGHGTDRRGDVTLWPCYVGEVGTKNFGGKRRQCGALPRSLTVAVQMVLDSDGGHPASIVCIISRKNSEWPKTRLFEAASPPRQEKGHACLLEQCRPSVLSRPAAWTQTELEPQTLCCRLRPGFAAIGRTSNNASPDRLQFGVSHWLVDPFQPLARPRHGASRQIARPHLVFLPIMSTGPTQTFRAPHQVGTQRITFDVTQHRQEVLVLFSFLPRLLEYPDSWSHPPRA
jgi:hypothetical protein